MRPALDWRRLLDEQRIPYIERGPNVKRGEINIRCPFCASADPSQHMGLNLQNGWWACWRNNNHRGKSPLRLLMVLLRVPYWQARKIAGLGDDYIDPEGFTAVAARVLGRLQPEEALAPRRSRFLAFPREFRPLLGPSARRHRQYLVQRGFHPDDIVDLSDMYGLQHAISGPWQDRIIIPFRLDGELVSWTARAIAPAMIRYRDLSIDESIVPPKHALFNHDAMMEGGNALILVEGPLDALKLDFYGRDIGVRSVALSTNSISDDQSFMLGQGVAGFKLRYVMLDNATQLGIADSMRLKQQLAFIPGLRILRVPYGLKDAGDLSARQALGFTANLINSEL